MEKGTSEDAEEGRMRGSGVLQSVRVGRMVDWQPHISDPTAHFENFEVFNSYRVFTLYAPLEQADLCVKS